MADALGPSPGPRHLNAPLPLGLPPALPGEELAGQSLFTDGKPKKQRGRGHKVACLVKHRCGL